MSVWLLSDFYAYPDRCGRGDIVFFLFVCLPLCLIVYLSATLALAITSEPIQIETSYLTCICISLRLHILRGDMSRSWSSFKVKGQI